MKSVKEKIQDLDEILHQKDIDDWNYNFMSSIISRMKANDWDTTTLTGKQVDKINAAWEKYCEA